MKAEKKAPRPLPEQLWTPEQAGAFLQKSRRAVKEMAYRREIPSIKLGREYRFDPKELAEWLDQKRRKPL